VPQPKRAKAPAALKLRVTVKGVNPPVWRRLLVRDDTTLADLHRTLQRLLGWSDGYLHEFSVAGVSFGAYDPGGQLSASPVRQAPRRGEETPLAALALKPRSILRYRYDFGSDWELSLLVEATEPSSEGERYPRCLDGARAAPPEESGGPWRYSQVVAILADPNHPDVAWAREWVGEEFDPAAFDREAVDRRLRDSPAPAAAENEKAEAPAGTDSDDETGQTAPDRPQGAIA
jgi:hypothetical protein